MSVQAQHDFASIDCPVSWPRPGEGYGLSKPPFRDEQLGAWILSRYADCDRVVRDHKTFSSKNVLGPSRGETFETLLSRIAGDPRAATVMTYFHQSGIASDGDLHARERSFFAKAFVAGRVQAYEPTITAICEELTSAVLGRTGVPFVREFAMPLPVRVIAHALGLPADDFLDIKRWSDGFEVLTGSPDPSPEQLDEFMTTAVEFTAYISPIIEQRRREPAGDIVSAIVGANDAGVRLETDEILAMIAALMLAGNETSTAAIAGTLLYLVRMPELQAQTRANPGLVPALVEEGLRLTAPAQGLFRTATVDTTVGGVAIAKGDHVFLRYNAANRDGGRYDEPLAPRLDRPDKRHIAFGHGVHTCAGAPLARTELRIALETLLARTTSITLSDREDAVVPVGNQMTARISEIYLDLHT